MYYFLLGYIVKVVGMEKGVIELIVIFLICFGVLFMLCYFFVYGEFFCIWIEVVGVNCWLVNMGWIGGVYGVGICMLIEVICWLLNVVFDGFFNSVEFCEDLNFGFMVFIEVLGVDMVIFDLRGMWLD